MTTFLDEDEPRVADYFVVAGLNEAHNPQNVELNFPGATVHVNHAAKDPIIDICVIDRTMEESCPQGFTCVDLTPSGFPADLNHGSFTAHSLFVCYRRGRDKPPLIDLGVYYEGLENIKQGVSIVSTTPSGKSANVNNRSGMGSFPIYLTFRRADESSPQSTLVVTDICVILSNKNEVSPYAYCLINKNLNKGMLGSSVFLCYKKSVHQGNSVTFKPDLLGRYPAADIPRFPLPPSVPLFCLPMGSPIECWSSKKKHPLPSFSSFVLTTERSEKVYGAVVTFCEPYPENLLQEEHKYTLGLLRADGKRSLGDKSLHTVKAICLLSRWPLFDAFRDFLIFIYRLTVSPIKHMVPIERHIAHFIHRVPFPSPERPRVQYQMSPMHATVLTRPQITPIPLSGASFLSLLDDFGADNTLTVVTLALLEYKILIHSLRRFEITRVAEALLSLLFPFKWQCTYVPLCPLEMAYVLEAPTPFIVGLDSRYFDICEPPPDVVCVNLDTNTVTQVGDKKFTWKMLPRRPAKHARNILQNLFTEIKQSNLRVKEHEGEYMTLNPSASQTKRHMQIEITIQETILKFMSVIMNGYRDHLLPLTEAPSVGTTDPGSLFDMQGFIRKQDKPSQRFFSMLMSTQLFAAFIENRSFASFSGSSAGESAGKAATMVFFDECIDRLRGEYIDNVHLIDSDALSSERTTIILPPDEKAEPNTEGYSYTTFPELQEELFSLTNEEGQKNVSTSEESKNSHKRRRSSTFLIGKRTKQELKVSAKQAKLCNKNSRMWARLLLSHAYCAWFGCLLDYSRRYHSKASILRDGLGVLHVLENCGCIPLPDETSYRILMHLCCLYNKPVLAVRVFQFLKDCGTQLSAVTYGLYNKALLECSWPSSDRDGYMLWKKFKNVFFATVYLRTLAQKRKKSVGSAQEGSDARSISSSSKNLEVNKSQDDDDQFKDLATPLQNETQPLVHLGDGDNISSDLLTGNSQGWNKFSESTQDSTSNLSEISGTDILDLSEMSEIRRRHSSSIVRSSLGDPGGDGTQNNDNSQKQSKKSIGKLVIERKDITDLALDPLSPTIQLDFVGLHQADQSSFQGTVVQNDEVDSLSDKLSSLNDLSVIKDEPSTTFENSVTSTPTTAPKRPGLLKRSFTFAPGSSLSENIWSSGSKINSLLKATTIGVATKAKRLASNIAKDFNETVQSNLSYYTPEKLKGSLGSLSEVGHDGENNDQRLRYDFHDYHGSQSSLLSLNEKTSARSAGSSKMNHGALNSPRCTLAMSTTSLNSKAAIEMEVTMSSCSQCPQCLCLVYDEEIMAGWMADESNLNTHCPFCNQLFVPHLTIRLTNCKNKSDVGNDDAVSSRGKLLTVSENSTGTSTNQESAVELDLISVQYLSPLVLRKELESLLDNEGMSILGEPEIVDNHPIVYWNFVWYFRRLNLQSNLYNLVLDSNYMKSFNKSSTEQAAESKKYSDRVAVFTLWNNIKEYKDISKSPLYLSYLQSRRDESSEKSDSTEIFQKIESCIMSDDVKTPILLMLDEYSSHYGTRLPRHSVYREILFFIIVSLGKDSIDLDAYDKAYREAYDSLSVKDLEKTVNCDKPPSREVVACRLLFGELDLS